MDTHIIEKLFEDYSDILKNSIYYLSKPDKNNLISFVKGYSRGKGNKELIDYLRLYLLHNYQINNEYNTWEQQVDHYSYLMGMGWFEGFDHLLSEILSKKQKLSSTKNEFDEAFLVEVPRGDVKTSVQLKNGVTIKQGDLLNLADKIGEDFKTSKFYDAFLRNPSWDLFYPSDKDFKYLNFYHNKGKYFEDDTDHLVTTFGKVRRLFSDSIIKVKFLAIHENEIIIYTDLFRINAEKAFQEKEIYFLNQGQNAALTDLDDLIEKVEQYEMGLFSRYDLTKKINDWCFYHLQDLNKNWHRYRFSMGMKWNKITDTFTDKNKL